MSSASNGEASIAKPLRCSSLPRNNHRMGSIIQTGLHLGFQVPVESFLHGRELSFLIRLFNSRHDFFTFLLQGSDTGQVFGELFQLLVRLSNECEAGGEWVIGAPLMELPLSEQIVVLHRLDHSVHTARLWIVQEAKIIAHTWELDVFFLLVKGDIVNCLEELSYLKVKRREFTFFPPPSFKIILKNPLVPACRSRQRIIDRFCERPGIRLRENEGKNCIRGERERGSAPGMLRFCSLFGKK